MSNSEEEVKFLIENENTHFMQSEEWAEIKNNWKCNKIVIKDDNTNQIKGLMQILIKRISFLNSSILYCPRGPVFDYEDKETFNKFVIELKRIAKENNAFIFRMDTPIETSNEVFKKMILEAGLKTKKNINHDINKVIQPKYEMVLNLKDKSEEELLSLFSQKTRYNIRLAIKKGVTIEEGNENDIQEFYDILCKTSQRDQFTIRDISYYKKLFNVMSKGNHIKLYFAKFEGKRIATTFEIIYGKKAWYLYGGSLREHSNVMPNYLIQWTMIKEAISKGCTSYNFGGVSGYIDENSPSYGVYRFKKGFNPDFKEYIDEINLVFKPFMNFIFNIAFKLRKLF